MTRVLENNTKYKSENTICCYNIQLYYATYLAGRNRRFLLSPSYVVDMLLFTLKFVRMCVV